MKYTFEDFKKEVFTKIERMTEDVDSLEGFDQTSDNWWSGEKEIEIHYDDCIAWAKCEIQLHSDWEECFDRGDVNVFEGGASPLGVGFPATFSEETKKELSKYLTW